MPLIRTRADLLDRGFRDSEIRRALAAGTLVRIRRGSYVDGPLDAEEEARAALITRVAAVSARIGGNAVFSHSTAAALWDLPFLDALPETTHVTMDRPAHGARRANVHQHTGPLTTEEIMEYRGIRLTTLPRTLVDVARTEGFRQGVVMADHALRQSPDPEALRRAMEVSIQRIKASVGIGQARRMAAFAVPEAESPGESISRVVLWEQDVPTPQLQYRLVLRLAGGGWGEFRTDFAWERQKVVGEFDGKVKYERFGREGESAGDVVFREKRREDAIREAGWAVMRWTWGDLERPEVLGRRLREVLATRS